MESEKPLLIALSIKAEPEEPSQTLSIIAESRGKVLTTRVFAE